MKAHLYRGDLGFKGKVGEGNTNSWGIIAQVGQLCQGTHVENENRYNKKLLYILFRLIKTQYLYYTRYFKIVNIYLN